MTTQLKPETSSPASTAPAHSGWIVSFVATLVAMLCLQASNLGFSPLFPSIQEAFGFTFTTLGLFKGMYGLISIFASVPAGLSVKRFGEKGVLISSLAMVALGLLMLSRASSAEVAFAGRGVWIVGYRFAFVCVMTAMALTCPKHLRGRCMGILGAVAALSSVVGAPLASDIQQNFGWRRAVMGFAGVAVVGAVIFAPLYRGSGQAPPPKNAGPAKSAPRGGAFASPLVWAVALLCGFSGVTSLTTVYYLPAAGREVFSGRISGAYLISAGFFVAIFINLLFGFLMDRFHKWRVMSVLAVILMLGSLIMTAPSLIAFSIGGVIVVAVGHAAVQQSYSIAAEVFHGKETGNVMGIVSFMSGVVNFLIPWALGGLRDRTGGFNAGWLLLALLSGITLVLVIALWRRSALVGNADTKGDHR